MRFPTRRARASRRTASAMRRRVPTSAAVSTSPNQLYPIQSLSLMAPVYQTSRTYYSPPPSMVAAQLPNYIRTYRKRACLTQGEVGFILGLKSGAGISRHERFKQTPDLQTLLAYEMLFRTPV